MKLKNGDILICSGDGLIPTLIKKVTRSTYSHAALYFEVWGKAGIIEAQMDGINWKPFDAWKEKYEYDFIVYRNNEITEETAKTLSVKAFEKCGHTSYDFVSFIIRQPIKLITGKWKNKGTQKEGCKMICSEYVAWVYDIKDWFKMTPDDLQKYLHKNLSVIKKELDKKYYL